MTIFTIAEVGVNHNGDIGRAIELIDIAAEAGASAVKFQTFTANNVIVIGTDTVAYQKANSGSTDQHKMLTDLELSADDHTVLKEHCDKQGIEFLSTAFDIPAISFLIDLGIKRIKIPSGEITNVPFLNACAQQGLPVILSTGMATLEEIETAVAVLKANLAPLAVSDGSPPLTILQCTSEYPAPFADCNLNVLRTLQNHFNVPVGFSDHSAGIALAPAAVALGARVIEKHITLSRDLPGPDHAASIEPDEFRMMMMHIQAVHTSLGDGIKQPSVSEIQTAKLVRRGLKAARAISAGDILTHDDVAILRPATGLPPSQIDSVIGKKINVDLDVGEPLTTDFFDVSS